MSRIFGEIRQIAYITRDFDAVLDFFIKTGIGPWFVTKKRMMKGVNYRGTITDVEISLGMANSGALQVEVIAQTNDTPSVYRDWLNKYPDQLMIQHIASWPTDFHATDKRIRAAGYENIWAGEVSGGAFGYYEHRERPEFYFETAELTEGRRYIWGVIEQAAQNWDGKDPIRPFPVAPA